MVVLLVTDSERSDLMHGLDVWIKDYGHMMIGDTKTDLRKLCNKIDAAGEDRSLKLLQTPGAGGCDNCDDWEAVYADDGTKLWEGNGIDSNALQAVANYFNYTLVYHEFVDDNKFDDETPDNFDDIRGIKQLI
jgi:hypothetical protein